MDTPEGNRNCSSNRSRNRWERIQLVFLRPLRLSLLLLLALLFLFFSKSILRAATTTWTFADAATYVVSDVAEILINGTNATLKNNFPPRIDDTQAEFDAGTYTQSSWQTNKVATSTSNVPVQRTVANGLVALFNLDEPSGTSHYDYAGGFVGTRTGATIGTSSKSGFGYDLSVAGTSQYVSIPYDAKQSFGTGDLSISFWFNYSSITNGSTLISKSGDSLAGTTGNWTIIPGSNGALDFRTRVDGSTVVDCSGAAISASTWHHVVFTRSSTSVKGYLDGNTTTPYCSVSGGIS